MTASRPLAVWGMMTIVAGRAVVACSAEAPPSPVTARVTAAGRTVAEINVADVEAVVAKAPNRDALSPAQLDRLKAEALAELVNRALVNWQLDREQFLPQEKPWEARWVRYLAFRISDDESRKYFESHRREFDGTRRSVRHILFQVDPPEDAAAVERAVAAARSLRQRIVAKEIWFEEAARRHSHGPSRDRGGALGWIERRGPMVESFGRAAFALEMNQISEPVVSPFGVHLIECTAEKPGTLTWEECHRAVRRELSSQLFHQMADRVRGETSIEFTGASPHLDPVTRRVVGER